MVMKAVLDSLDGVPANIQTEYKKSDDGKFYLDLEGVDAHPSTQPLANTMKNVKTENTTLKRDRDAAKARADELEAEINGMREGSIPKADMDAYKRSHEGKYTKDIGERDVKITQLSGTVERLLVTDASKSLANELVAKPEYVDVLLPHVRSRMKLEYNDAGEPNVVVLDKDGKVSALSVEDLKKEVLSNKAFAPILRGSHSSGGSAPGGNDRTSGPSGKRIDVKTFDMSKATPAEVVAYRKQQAGQS